MKPDPTPRTRAWAWFVCGVIVLTALVVPLLELLHWKLTFTTKSLKIHFDGPRAFVDTSAMVGSSNSISLVSVNAVTCKVLLTPDHGEQAVVGELSIANVGDLDSSTSVAARPVDVTVDSVDFDAVRSILYSAWKTEDVLEVEIACDVFSTMYAYRAFPVPLPAIRQSLKQTVDLRREPQSSTAADPPSPARAAFVAAMSKSGENLLDHIVVLNSDGEVDPVDAVPPPGYAHSFHGWKEGEQRIESVGSGLKAFFDALSSIQVVDDTITIPVHYATTAISLLPSSVDAAVIHVPTICYYIGDASSVQWTMCVDAFDVDLVAEEMVVDSTVTIRCANLDPAAESSSCGALLPYLVMRKDFLSAGKLVLVADAEKGGRQPTFPELLLGTHHQSSFAVTTKSTAAANARTSSQAAHTMADGVMTCFDTENLFFMETDVELCVGRDPLAVTVTFNNVNGSVYLSTDGNDATIMSFAVLSPPLLVSGELFSHHADNTYTIHGNGQAYIPEWDVNSTANINMVFHKDGHSASLNISHLSIQQVDLDPMELTAFAVLSTPDTKSMQWSAGYTWHSQYVPFESGSMSASFALGPSDSIAVGMSVQYGAELLVDLKKAYNSADVVDPVLNTLMNVLSTMLESITTRLGLGSVIGTVNFGLTYHLDILPADLPTTFPTLPKIPAFTWKMIGDHVAVSEDVSNLVHWVNDLLFNRLDGHTTFSLTIDNTVIQLDLSGYGYAFTNSTAATWIDLNKLSIGDLDVSVGHLYAAETNWETIRVNLYDQYSKETVAFSTSSLIAGHNITVSQASLRLRDEQVLRARFHAVTDSSPVVWNVSIRELYVDYVNGPVVSNGTAMAVFKRFDDTLDVNVGVFDHTKQLMFAVNADAEKIGDGLIAVKNVVIRTNSFLLPTIDFLQVDLGEELSGSSLHYNGWGPISGLHLQLDELEFSLDRVSLLASLRYTIPRFGQQELGASFLADFHTGELDASTISTFVDLHAYNGFLYHSSTNITWLEDAPLKPSTAAFIGAVESYSRSFIACQGEHLLVAQCPYDNSSCVCDSSVQLTLFDETNTALAVSTSHDSYGCRSFVTSVNFPDCQQYTVKAVCTATTPCTHHSFQIAKFTWPLPLVEDVVQNYYGPGLYCPFFHYNFPHGDRKHPTMRIAQKCRFRACGGEAVDLAMSYYDEYQQITISRCYSTERMSITVLNELGVEVPHDDGVCCDSCGASATFAIDPTATCQDYMAIVECSTPGDCSGLMFVEKKSVIVLQENIAVSCPTFTTWDSDSTTRNYRACIFEVRTGDMIQVGCPSGLCNSNVRFRVQLPDGNQYSGSATSLVQLDVSNTVGYASILVKQGCLGYETCSGTVFVTLTRKAGVAPVSHPTRRPSKRPTVRPTRKPSHSPSVTPSRAPTIAPTRAPTAPTIAPTESPSKLPMLAPSVRPSARPSTSSPTQELPKLLINQQLVLSNVSSSTLSAAAQQAVVLTVANILNVDSDFVTYLGASMFTASSAINRVQGVNLQVSTQTKADMLNYAGFNGNTSAVFGFLSSTLNAAVNNGLFASTLHHQATLSAAPELSGASADSAASVFIGTVYNPTSAPTAPPKSSPPDPTVMIIIIVVVVGVVVLAAGVGLVVYLRQPSSYGAPVVPSADIEMHQKPSMPDDAHATQVATQQEAVLKM